MIDPRKMLLLKMLPGLFLMPLMAIAEQHGDIEQKNGTQTDYSEWQTEDLEALLAKDFTSTSEEFEQRYHPGLFGLAQDIKDVATGKIKVPDVKPFWAPSGKEQFEQEMISKQLAEREAEAKRREAEAKQKEQEAIRAKIRIDLDKLEAQREGQRVWAIKQGTYQGPPRQIRQPEPRWSESAE